MRCLILGATGDIGGAVLAELRGAGYQILGLARSDRAAAQIAQAGAQAVRGDLADPDEWIDAVGEVEAVIHVAATFDDSMAAIDRRLVETLAAEAERLNRRLNLIYTGGCWLYGATGDVVADEDSPLIPPPADEWAVRHGALALSTPSLATRIIHPAMVYERDGGVLTRFAEEARNARRISIWGSADTRWPVVHRRDLAAAYRLVLQQAAPGAVYNVAAQEGVRVGDIADVMARRLGASLPHRVIARSEVLTAEGAGAEGWMLDQQMTAARIQRDLGWRPTHTDILTDLR